MIDIVEWLQSDGEDEWQRFREARVTLGLMLAEAANEITRLRNALDRIGKPKADIGYCRDGHEEAVLIARATLEGKAW